MASTGFILAGGAADRGGGDVAWTNLANIYDGNDATGAACAMSSHDLANTLEGNTFAASVPSGATIDGIEVRARIGVNATGHELISVGLVVGGVAAGTYKSPFTGFTTSATNYTYGGATDKWGLTPSQAQVVASNFGSRWIIEDADGTGSETSTVYAIWVNIYYTVVASNFELSSAVTSPETTTVVGASSFYLPFSMSAAITSPEPTTVVGAASFDLLFSIGAAVVTPPDVVAAAAEFHISTGWFEFLDSVQSTTVDVFDWTSIDKVLVHDSVNGINAIDEELTSPYISYGETLTVSNPDYPLTIGYSTSYDVRIRVRGVTGGGGHYLTEDVVRIVVNGSQVGTNFGQTGAKMPATVDDEYGPSWGHTFVQANFNSSLGFALRVMNDGGNSGTVYIDSILIKIDYVPMTAPVTQKFLPFYH